MFTINTVGETFRNCDLYVTAKQEIKATVNIDLDDACFLPTDLKPEF